MRFNPTSLMGVLIVDAIIGASAIGIGFAVGTHAAMDASSKLGGTAIAAYSLWMWRLSQLPEPPPEQRSQPPSSIRCFRCKADIAVTPELLGKKTKCPKCG